MTTATYFGKLRSIKYRFASGEVCILGVTSPVGFIEALNGDTITIGAKSYKMTTDIIKQGVFKAYPELAALVLKAAEAKLETIEL